MQVMAPNSTQRLINTTETLKPYSHLLKKDSVKYLIQLIKLEIMLKNSSLLDVVAPKVTPEHNFQPK